MSEPKAPKIEFPCQYPIKVMGEAVDGFEIDVLEIVQRHSPDVTTDNMNTRRSAQGNYLSVTIVIEATGEEQLQILFADLKGHSAVRLVL